MSLPCRRENTGGLGGLVGGLPSLVIELQLTSEGSTSSSVPNYIDEGKV